MISPDRRNPKKAVQQAAHSIMLVGSVALEPHTSLSLSRMAGVRGRHSSAFEGGVFGLIHFNTPQDIIQNWHTYLEWIA